jgi:hypothetical protein
MTRSPAFAAVGLVIGSYDHLTTNQPEKLCDAVRVVLHLVSFGSTILEIHVRLKLVVSLYNQLTNNYSRAVMQPRYPLAAK